MEKTIPALDLKTFQAPLSSVAKAAAKDSAMQVMDTNTSW
jgi:hypothetical protein